MLLYADDMVLFTTSPESLQSQIDSLYQYSLRWGLKINIRKTKVCIFGRSQNDYNSLNWSIDNQKLEIVNSFCYLGVKFTRNDLLNEAVKALSYKL